MFLFCFFIGSYNLTMAQSVTYVQNPNTETNSPRVQVKLTPISKADMQVDPYSNDYETIKQRVSEAYVALFKANPPVQYQFYGSKVRVKFGVGLWFKNESDIKVGSFPIPSKSVNVLIHNWNPDSEGGFSFAGEYHKGILTVRKVEGTRISGDFKCDEFSFSFDNVKLMK